MQTDLKGRFVRVPASDVIGADDGVSTHLRPNADDPYVGVVNFVAQSTNMAEVQTLVGTFDAFVDHAEVIA